MSTLNRQINLAARPAGFPKLSDFELVETPLPEVGEDQVLIKTEWITVDPYLRGRMNDARGYSDPLKIGAVVQSGACGKVLASKNPRYQEGDCVQGLWGWQDYCLSSGRGIEAIDPELAPVQTCLGVLGMPGMTAYFGLLSITDPQPGETVFVSGAAGAVGELVGQIAKIKGCKTYGSAGSDEKVRYLIDECGYDGVFNYKTTGKWPAAIREMCPQGIDVYFDNVGGDMTDAVVAQLNEFARVSVCGAISAYNLTQPDIGPRLFTALLVKQVKVEGFLVSRFYRQWPEAIPQMAQWIQEGKIRYREDILEGLENTPEAFIRMLKGENKGKQLVKV